MLAVVVYHNSSKFSTNNIEFQLMRIVTKRTLVLTFALMIEENHDSKMHP